LQSKTITFACNLMNMLARQILTYFKNAFVIVLAMILMAGVTGFSYQAHYCHDKLSGIALYPELGFKQSISCGCAVEANPLNSRSNSSSPVLTKNSCCSNVSFFSKLTIESQINGFNSGISIQPAVIAYTIIFSDSHNFSKEILSDLDTGTLPVPLAGRQLVLFLSQQRIPSISYNC